MFDKNKLYFTVPLCITTFCSCTKNEKEFQKVLLSPHIKKERFGRGRRRLYDKATAHNVEMVRKAFVVTRARKKVVGLLGKQKCRQSQRGQTVSRRKKEQMEARCGSCYPR